MPARTTSKQRMIALIRQHLAGPGVSVTESRALLDSASGKLREVDVVAEGDLNGERLFVSVEVIDRKRKATLTWVDEMIGKHICMPTNQLVLVSWSGFSAPALTKIAAIPRMSAVTPKPVVDEDGSERMADALYVGQVTLKAERVRARLRRPDGTLTDWTSVPPNLALYGEHGDHVGYMSDLVDLFLKSEPVGHRLSTDAYQRQDRDDLKWFTVGVDPLGPVGLSLRYEEVDPPEFHTLGALEVSGPLRWGLTELRFAVVDIDGRAHGIAQAPMLGKDAVWVATPKTDGSEEVDVSWRALDD